MINNVASIALIGQRTISVDASITPEEKVKILSACQDSNNTLIDYLFKDYICQKYSDFYILSLGCDIGFGADVKTYCQANKFKFVSVDVKMFSNQEKVNNSYRPFAHKEIINSIYKARHLSILALATEVLIKKPSYISLLDDLIIKLKSTEIPYTIYDEHNTPLEYKGDPFK